MHLLADVARDLLTEREVIEILDQDSVIANAGSWTLTAPESSAGPLNSRPTLTESLCKAASSPKEHPSIFRVALLEVGSKTRQRQEPVNRNTAWKMKTLFVSSGSRRRRGRTFGVQLCLCLS